MLAVPDGHLERVEGEGGAQGARHPPAHDAPGEDVDDEGGVGEARPRRHVGDVGHPELVGPAGHEATIDQVGRSEPHVGGMVVRRLRARERPERPIWRIRRSVRQREMQMPSRLSWRQTFRGP